MTEFLIKRGRIGCVPGVDFGPTGEGHVRFCFARDRAGAHGRARVDAGPRWPGVVSVRCRPPSTRIVSPVMKSESMSASTAFAISSAPPQRPSGVAFSTAA